MTIRHTIDERLFRSTYTPEADTVMAHRFWEWYFENLDQFNREGWSDNRISLAAFKAGYEMGRADAASLWRGNENG